MRAYIIRRTLLLIPTLFLLSIIVFLSVRFIPGDVIDVMESMTVVAGGTGGGFDRETLERLLGLDVPVWVQYGRWDREIFFLHGSLGTSTDGGLAGGGEDHRETSGHPGTGGPGHRHRVGDRAARRHLFGDAPG